jgi:hypothetical protein
VFLPQIFFVFFILFFYVFVFFYYFVFYFCVFCLPPQVPLRIAKALSHAGVSITVTSFCLEAIALFTGNALLVALLTGSPFVVPLLLGNLPD